MNSMPPEGGADYHRALIGELQNILKVIPVNPGFQYVSADNCFAVPQNYVPGTKGTVLIGTTFLDQLLKQKQGGVTAAGVLAHECAHIYQYFSSYYDRLKGPTAVLYELQADALAGYYLQKKLGGSPARLNAVQRDFIQMGTYNPQAATYHGTPGLRNAALDKGFLIAQGGSTFEEAATQSEPFVKALAS
jgi:predicted metalloprotease